MTCVCTSGIAGRRAVRGATDPGAARGRVQYGPLGLTPSVALANLGIDTNVFNDVDDPKIDFTFTVSPQVDASLRVRRVQLQVMARSDLCTSIRTRANGALTPPSIPSSNPGTRITPWVGASVSFGRQRFGYDIDLRLRRVTRDAGAGGQARFTSPGATWS